MSKINENFFKNRKYEGKINYFEKEINKKESNNELIKNANHFLLSSRLCIYYVFIY